MARPCWYRIWPSALRCLQKSCQKGLTIRCSTLGLRAVSSVVEHYIDTVGVTGSNPVPRTLSLMSSLASGTHASVICGAARFTVITPHCIRLEYAPKNGFVDAPTLFASERSTRFPDARMEIDSGRLKIDTGKFTLTYRDNGLPFCAENLEVVGRGATSEISWAPGQTQKQNLGGPLPTLDEVSGPVPLPPGLLARDGWHIVDDSGRPLLVDGWIQQRPGGVGPGQQHSHGAAENTDLDWYLFFYGSDFKAALVSLASISGPAALPRREVLGSWYCRWHRYTADDFRAIVQEYRDHDFPLDILVMDMDWHTQATAKFGYGDARNLGWTGYTWNYDLIPDPAGLLAEFKRDGITVTLNDHPHDGVRSHEDCYEDFMAMLPPGTRANPPFDAGDPRYMEAFFKAAHAPLEKQGVSFWWVDWQQNHFYPDVFGVPGLRHLPWLNHLYFCHSQHHGRRGQGFSRWGGWGDHKHPIQFSGDARANWAVLDFEVHLTLASANAGCFFWAHDIGGFSGERNPETFTRWVQFGALSASLRLHSVGDDLDRRPWLWGQPFEDIMRAAYQLRTQLLPYIYASARECYDHMRPLLRPLYYEYPDAEEAYQHPTEYLLGPDLLVAPITTPGSGTDGRSERQVWFPPGIWFNFFTGEKFVGTTTKTISAHLSEIPLYVRAGAPLALQPPTPRMASTPLSHLVVRCFPGEKGASSLYEDDGHSPGYQQDEFARTQLGYEAASGEILLHVSATEGSFAGQLSERAYTFELPGTSRGVSATAAGRPVAIDYLEPSHTNMIRVPARDIRKNFSVVLALAP